MIFVKDKISESPDLIPGKLIFIQYLFIDMNNCFADDCKLKKGSVNCFSVVQEGSFRVILYEIFNCYNGVQYVTQSVPVSYFLIFHRSESVPE